MNLAGVELTASHAVVGVLSHLSGLVAAAAWAYLRRRLVKRGGERLHGMK